MSVGSVQAGGGNPFAANGVAAPVRHHAPAPRDHDGDRDTGTTVPTPTPASDETGKASGLNALV